MAQTSKWAFLADRIAMLTGAILIPEPPTIHNCHRGRCVRRAKYTVFRDGTPLENLCVHHAVRFCVRNGLRMPKEMKDADNDFERPIAQD